MKKILKFEKNDCAPCKAVSGYLDSKQIPHEKINAYDNPKLASQFHLRSVPVVILLEGEGKYEKEIMRTVGYKTEELDKLIENFKK